MIADATLILSWLAMALLLFAALHDIAFRTIPDWVSIALLVDGVLLRLTDRLLPAAIGCGLVVFVLAGLCWRRGWLGGGDVKLLAACAVLLPPWLVPGFIADVAFAGGALALLYLCLERLVPPPRLIGPWPRQSSGPMSRTLDLVRRVRTVEYRRIRRRASLPYAAAISAAAVLMLVKG